MTPVTDAERLTWQRQAHIVLGRLLERAVKEHLPPIPWRVGTTRNLHGECSPYDGDPAAGFAAWKTALGKPDRERREPDWEREREGDTIRLTAVWDRYEGCQVVLTAAIRDDSEPA